MATIIVGDNGQGIGTGDADEIIGSNLADYIIGFGENDTLWGFGGSDKIYGEEGDDLIFGGDGEEDGNLFSSPENGTPLGTYEDELFGGDGDDTIYGEGSDDLIDGGADDDVLYGGVGYDRLIGNTGNDLLIGGSHDDTIVGANDRNSRPGLYEVDIMWGDNDPNSLQQGANANYDGRDTFVIGKNGKVFYNDGLTFSNGYLDYALIKDFNPNEDTIQLAALQTQPIGSSPFYYLEESPFSRIGGSAIYYSDGVSGHHHELIAIIENQPGLKGHVTNFDFFTYS